MRLLCSLAALALAAWSAPPAHGQERVDLALALAVDASGSVDESEFALQMKGIAAAFRDAAVHEAIRQGPLGRIAVSLVLWSEPQYPKSATPWRIIASAEAAAAFARLVESHPRDVEAGGTGIGQALRFATRHIERSGLIATRRVIDLSGDGRETTPHDYVVQLWQGRAVAAGAGITVNGLAILNDVPTLDLYYRRQLITGPGAFVIVAAGYEDFAEAVRRKLLREIEDRPEIGLN